MHNLLSSSLYAKRIFKRGKTAQSLEKEQLYSSKAYVKLSFKKKKEKGHCTMLKHYSNFLCLIKFNRGNLKCSSRKQKR